MPTTRTRRNRGTRIRVTDHAVALYREARPLRDGAIRCANSDRECRHETCGRFWKLDGALRRELRLRPWQHSPLEHPDDLAGDVRDMREELEAAL